MKRIVISILIVIVFAATARTQEVKPSGMWLNLLFPEVKEYMDNMQAQINRMEAAINIMSIQVNELRNDYVKYQHNVNLALLSMSEASTFFAIYQETQKIEDWNHASEVKNDTIDYLYEAAQYGDRLGLIE